MKNDELIRLDRDELEHMAKMTCNSDIYYELVDNINEIDKFDLIDIINGKEHDVLERYEIRE